MVDPDILLCPEGEEQGMRTPQSTSEAIPDTHVPYAGSGIACRLHSMVVTGSFFPMEYKNTAAGWLRSRKSGDSARQYDSES